MNVEKVESHSIDDSEVIQDDKSPLFKKMGKSALSDVVNGEQMEEATEKYLVVNGIADKYGVNPWTVKDRIEKLGISGVELLDSTGKPACFYSPEQQDQIREALEGHLSLKDAPEGYLTLFGVAKELKLSRDKIGKIIEKLGLEGTAWMSRAGKSAIFYSPEQQDQIREALKDSLSLEYAPEGYLTTLGLSKSLKKDRSTVERIINELGITGIKYKNSRGNTGVFYSPEDKKRVEEGLGDLLTLSNMPKDYFTIDMVSNELKVDKSTVEKKIGELKIIGTRYLNGHGQASTFYSPEQLNMIRESLSYLLLAEKAPSGYCTASGFAENKGVDKGVVKRAVEALGIEGKMLKDKRGIVCAFLSPGEQGELEEYIERSFSGTSIPENTIAFYLNRAGKNVLQGIRPDWLKNPKSGRNLEVDIYIDPPGIGIEYDGCFYHQDIERDVKKDNIAQENGYRIIHIREDGCPEMPEGSVCIRRKNNKDDADLGECIKKCFEKLGISAPDIDIVRDKKDIMAFMRQRVLDKLDSARIFEELSVAP